MGLRGWIAVIGGCFIAVTLDYFFVRGSFLLGWVAFGLLIAGSWRPASAGWTRVASIILVSPFLAFAVVYGPCAFSGVSQGEPEAAVFCAFPGALAGIAGFFAGLSLALQPPGTRRFGGPPPGSLQRDDSN
jgi:hypothetical protein